MEECWIQIFDGKIIVAAIKSKIHLMKSRRDSKSDALMRATIMGM